MKTIIATVGAVMTAVTLGAQEADEDSAEGESEEEASIFEAGVDFDFYSAYVWRNAVQSDRMVMQPCVWGDFTMLDPFYFGFSVWQDYDVISRRREVFGQSLTETDYNIHAGYTAYESEDGNISLVFEVGHEWNINQFVRDEWHDDSPSTHEVYFKATFDNPIVGIYGQASWMYKSFGGYRSGFHYEAGLTKEIDLIEDTLTLGADWNVNFGDGRYLVYLYTGLSRPYRYWDDDEGDFVDADDYDRLPAGGFGGTTVKLYLTWSLTDWLSVKGTVAYTGILNSDLRNAIDDQGGDFWYEGDRYPCDLIWGGLSLNVAF